MRRTVQSDFRDFHKRGALPALVTVPRYKVALLARSTLSWLIVVLQGVSLRDPDPVRRIRCTKTPPAVKRFRRTKTPGRQTISLHKNTRPSHDFVAQKRPAVTRFRCTNTIGVSTTSNYQTFALHKAPPVVKRFRCTKAPGRQTISLHKNTRRSHDFVAQKHPAVKRIRCTEPPGRQIRR